MAKKEYMCPRCGYRALKMSTYIDHTQRKRICQLSVSDVKPTRSNVILTTSANAPVAVSPQPAPVNISNTNITTNNNLFVINMEAPTKNPQPFPYQDLKHLTDDYKRKIIDTCTNKGFAEGVRDMFGALYFDPSQPQNMNVVIREGQRTKVFRERKWQFQDTGDTLKEMLEEHGNTIYNFPEDVDVEKSSVDAIDRAYEGEEHLDDPVLTATLKQVAEASMKAFDRALVKRYWNIFQGLMMVDPKIEGGESSSTSAVGPLPSLLAVGLHT